MGWDKVLSPCVFGVGIWEDDDQTADWVERFANGIGFTVVFHN